MKFFEFTLIDGRREKPVLVRFDTIAMVYPWEGTSGKTYIDIGSRAVVVKEPFDKVSALILEEMNNERDI